MSELEKYNLALRTGLYPKGFVRIGHILETYIEPPVWVNLRQFLLGNWWGILIVTAVIFWLYKVSNSVNGNTRFKSLKWVWVPLTAGLIIFGWQLKNIPPAVYTDEAVTGYNAYSVLLTGRDEYGQTMPILFKYLGSWLPGLNIYLMVPLIKIWGLNATGIRLQSVIFGELLILVIYAVVRLKTKCGRTAFWGTLFIAITPWVVFYARTGYETILGIMLTGAGVGLIGRGGKKIGNVLWGFTALILSTYDAHVFRYLFPILLLGWVIIYREDLKNWTGSQRIKFVSLLVIGNFCNLWLILTPAFWVKNLVYKDAGLLQIVINVWTQIKIYLTPVTFFGQAGDIDLQHRIPGLGLYYWWMIFPIGLGILGWIRRWRKNIWWWYLLAVSAIPAVLSGAFISTQRAVGLIIPFGLVMAEGLRRFNKWLLICLFIYSGVLLWRSYFVLFPGLSQEAWNYGYGQLAEVIKGNPGAKFVIDNSRNPRNYILELFYTAYSPDVYQLTSRSEIKGNYYYSGATQDDHKFVNIEFRPIVWKTDECRQEILAGDELAISGGQAREHRLTKLGEVRSQTGKMLLQWYRTNPEQKCKI